MKIKRKMVLAIVLVAIGLFGQVCSLPKHNQYVGTIQSFVFAFLIGTATAVVFIIASGVGAWLTRKKNDRIKLVSDCLCFAIFSILSFVSGFSAIVLVDSAL